LERCCHAEDMGGIMRHVYIIETGNGHKKIGVATDMNQRMQQLKTGISTGIKSVLFTDKFHNAIAIETMLKKANESINLTGEWFDGDLNLCGIEFHFYSVKKEIKDRNGVMLFCDGLHLLSSIANKQTMFLYHMAARMNENNIVYMTPLMKEEIINKIGSDSCDKQTLARQYLKALLRSGVIENTGTGSYKISAKLFA
jgi:predicted GIY-YIG superfamily endonuclease